MWQDLVNVLNSAVSSSSREACVSHRKPGSGTSPWGFTSKAELIYLLTISFRYPLALAAGNWQKEKRRRGVRPILEGGSSGGCKHTGVLRKCVQRMHIHIARHEKSNQLNLSLMVWRQDGDEEDRSGKWAQGGVGMWAMRKRMKINKEKSKHDKMNMQDKFSMQNNAQPLDSYGKLHRKRRDLETGSLWKLTIRPENWQEWSPIVSYCLF